MNGSGRDDIRKLLKEFGVKADEAVIMYLARNEGLDSIDIRVTLEDITEYGDSPPLPKLELSVEGTIRCKA